MWKALQRNSVDEIRAVLDKTPKAASEPFFDRDFEPPLCCAVRLRCDAGIIQLLVEHGANPKATDKHGLTPYELLQEAEAPADVNQWEMLLQPPLSASIDLTFGHLVTHLHLTAAPKRLTWYDALLLEPPLTAREIWCRTVTQILGDADAQKM